MNHYYIQWILMNKYQIKESRLSIFRIKIKYHNSELPPIVKYDHGDWIDLRAAETVHLKKGDYKLINLGVSIELPEEHEAYVVPRSSTYKNFKIIQTNSMGVIDESYNGDNDVWHMPVIAMEDTTINFGDRICQFRINRKQPAVLFDVVDSLSHNEDRGGIGSTGTK